MRASDPDWEYMGALMLDVVLTLINMFHYLFDIEIMLILFEYHFPALHQCLWHTGPYLSMN